ncbi:MAG: transcriptional regulator [Myxococcaceae bacterium]|nr:transcriptional regulator [Myxococcaceae bacterium]
MARDAFARFLAARPRATAEAGPELYLAFACGGGDPIALQAFETRYLPVARIAVKHLEVNADEVLQLLRVRFFVGPPPRILDFQGAGSLEGWVRASAVRIALDLKRRERTAAGVCSHELSQPDTELRHLKVRHGPAFERAFSQACASLSSRERAVLRLSTLGGASIDRIAATYGIHRATAARWLERIRDALHDRTLTALGAELGESDAGAASLLRLIASGLEVSLRRKLMSAEAH